MKLLILGHGGHGKDTVAEAIENNHGLKFTSSSMGALDVIWPALNAATYFKYFDKFDAFANRAWHRTLWKELITLYNTPDKGALCKKILSENDLYVGMRCKDEFAATRHLFDHIIWVDASKRLPPEPSMTIEFEPQNMLLLDNNGSLEDLEEEIECLAELFKPQPVLDDYSC